MNHSFTPSLIDALKCAKCKFDEVSHTDKATCQYCPNIGIVEIFGGNTLMCADCLAKEKALQAANTTPEAQQARVQQMNETIQLARAQDQTIELRSDMLNAQTVAIVEIKDAIDKDESIPANQKAYVLAKELKDRFDIFSNKIFDKRNELIELQNAQRALQTHLNTLANQLRVEERTALKIQDINYTPQEIKEKKPRAASSSGKAKGKKFDKTELRDKCAAAGVPEALVQTMVIAKNMTIDAAIEHWKRALGK